MSDINTNFPFLETLHVECTVCRETAQIHSLRIGWLEMRSWPTLPTGWTCIVHDGVALVYCPKHVVTIMVEHKS